MTHPGSIADNRCPKCHGPLMHNSAAGWTCPNCDKPEVQDQDDWLGD